MAEEEDVALAEARKLPLAERVSHKNWKVRGEAYDSIASACERAFDSDGVTEYGNLDTCPALRCIIECYRVPSCLYTFGLHLLAEGAGPLQALTWQKHQQTAMQLLWTRL